MSVYDRGWFRGLSWLAAFGYMGLIFYVSAQSTIPLPQRFPHQDKVLHFFCYFVLAFLLAHAASQGTQRQRFWTAFAIASAYGITDEIHQHFVPGRDMSALDWLADSAGAWVGAYLFLKSEPVWRKSARPLLREE